MGTGVVIDPKMKAVVITGVSTGIGYDATRYLVQEGYFVFGSVRNAEAKARLEGDFPKNFKALLFDVTDKEAIEEACHEVAEMMGGRTLCALVNNAGLAVPGPMQFLEDDKFRYQMEVGLFGTRNVINGFLPLLGASPGVLGSEVGGHINGPGRIINISSISGIFNTPMNGAYCVGKHALESLGEVYRRELYQYGIDVISIQPGPIQSQIWEKNTESMSEFADTDYGTMIAKTNRIMRRAQREALPAETISKLIRKIIEARRPRLSYVVHSRKLLATLLAKYLPPRYVDKLIARTLNR